MTPRDPTGGCPNCPIDETAVVVLDDFAPGAVGVICECCGYVVHASTVDGVTGGE